ncbi:MAG: hypothetical protein SO046_02860 [Actinomyces urogenitalis]|uniref:hypothetical protein n=1 Tax=Actinomyces urogenitalis TaxID=103621 RepID=UPI002A7F3CE8|nr:hypothetical protein [Actinomyces urogenitalis]MDY3678145.1 hypothetical protein [Actinomyces urogenitalis]
MEKFFVAINGQGYTVSSARKTGPLNREEVSRAFDIADLFCTPGIVTMHTSVGDVAVSVPTGGALVAVQPVQEV